MLRPSSTDRPAAPRIPAATRPGREFGRLRAAVAERPGPNGAAAIPPEIAGQDAGTIIPVDSAKAFIGPNGTYYDDRWRWMDWQGRTRSWNWAAAASFGVWFAYRRMYRYAGLYLGWLGLLVLAAGLGVPLIEVLTIGLATSIALGLFGNTLYLRHFRRIASRVARRHNAFAARIEAVSAAGGVDRRAAWAMVAAEIVLVFAVSGLLGLLGVGPDFRL